MGEDEEATKQRGPEEEQSARAEEAREAMNRITQIILNFEESS